MSINENINLVRSKLKSKLDYLKKILQNKVILLILIFFLVTSGIVTIVVSIKSSSIPSHNENKISEDEYSFQDVLKYTDDEIILTLQNKASITKLNDKFVFEGVNENDEKLLSQVFEKYNVTQIDTYESTSGNRFVRLKLGYEYRSDIECLKAVQNNDYSYLSENECEEEILRDKKLKELANEPSLNNIADSISPNTMFSINSIPIDEYYGYQWALDNDGQDYPTGFIRWGYWDSGTPGEDMNMSDVLLETVNEEEVIVAVLDSGIDFTHPDIIKKIWINVGELNGYEFDTFTSEGGIDINSNAILDCMDLLAYENQSNPGLSLIYDNIDNDDNSFVDDFCGWDYIGWETCEDDKNGDGTCDEDIGQDNYPADLYEYGGHGTGIAGIITAERNDIGIAGIASEVKIMPLRVGDTYGGVSSWYAMLAIEYAIQEGASVINMSFAGYWDAVELRDAIVNAYNSNIVLVAGAGNGYGAQGVMGYPARYREVIGVTATDSDGNLAYYVDHGSGIDVAAPGHDVLTLISTQSMCWKIPTSSCREISNTSPYFVTGGTSNSTPHITGLAALIRSRNPSLNNEQVRQLIINSVDDSGQNDYDIYYGYGKVNAYEATRIESIPFVKITNPIIEYQFSDIYNVKDYALVRDQIIISGVSSGQDIASWGLFLREDNSLDRNQIGSGINLDSSFSINIDTTVFGDNFYWLEIDAYNADGTKARDVVPIVIDNTNISDPTQLDVFGRGQIQIMGSINAYNFDHYEVYYTKPDGTISSDFVSIPDHTNPVSNGLLGTFDVNNISIEEHGEYTIYVKSYLQDGEEHTEEVTVIIDTMIIHNYPQKSNLFNYDPGGISYFNDKISFNRSREDIGYRLYMYDFISGDQFMQYPNNSEYSGGVEYFVPMYDYDFDGVDDYFYLYSTNGASRIDIIDSDGTLIQRINLEVPSSCYVITNRFYGIHVSDLDNNGFPEIIVGGCGRLFVFENGLEKAEYGVPIDVRVVGGEFDNAIASADINGDNLKEIFIAEQNSVSVWGNEDLDGDGLVDLLWDYPISSGFISQPTIADIDRDLDKEIILVSSNGSLYVLSSSGDIVMQDETGTSGNINSLSPMVANLDSDSDLEIVLQRIHLSYPYGIDVCVFNIDGSYVPGWPVYIPISEGYFPLVSDSMLVTNIDSDQENELIFTSNALLYALNSDGSYVAGWPRSLGRYGRGLMSSLFLVDRQGTKYLAVTFDANAFAVFEIGDISYSPYAQWIIHSANFARTGEYENSEPVRPKTDLKVTKSISGSNIYMGDAFYFNILVQNLGPETALDVEMVDNINGNFRINEVLTFVGTSTIAGTCPVTGQTVRCNWDSLEVGNVIQIKIMVTPEAVGSFVNTATVDTVCDDVNLSNNTSSVDVIVNQKFADLSIEISADKTSLLQGKNIRYSLLVGNNGPQEAVEVDVKFDVPQGLTINSVIPDDTFDCVVNSEAIVCNRSVMNVNEFAEIEIDAQVNIDAFSEYVGFEATVSSNRIDPDSSNNTIVIDIPLYAIRLIEDDTNFSSSSTIITFDEPGLSKTSPITPDVYLDWGVMFPWEYGAGLTKMWMVSHGNGKLVPVSGVFGFSGCKLSFIEPKKIFTMNFTNSVYVPETNLRYRIYWNNGEIFESDFVVGDINTSKIVGIESTHSDISLVYIDYINGGLYEITDFKFE